MERVVGHVTPFRDGVDDGEEYWASYFGIELYHFPCRVVGRHLIPPNVFCSEVGTRRSVIFQQYMLRLEWYID